MNKLIRGLTGVIVSLPGAYIAFFFIGWFCTLVVNFIICEGPPIGYFFYYRMVIWNLFLMSVLSAAGLVLASMVHVLVTNQLSLEAKGIWLLLLVMGNVLVLPGYWYFNIWRHTAVPLSARQNKLNASGGGEFRN